MLNGLDLFSGYGGITIALSDWVRPIAYCEIDRYCEGGLLSNMSRRVLRVSPIWDDIRTFEGRTFKDRIDIIYGGFPCQDISIAGLGKGLAGERSGLFFEIVRLAKEIQPKFVFLENVPAITSRGGLRVVREITQMGYDTRWCVISAASVGALHRRERWFLLAHSNGSRSGPHLRAAYGDEAQDGQEDLQQPISSGADVAHSQCERLSQCEHEKRSRPEKGLSQRGCPDVADARCPCERMSEEDRRDINDDPEWTSFHDPRCSRFWQTEPDMGRVADGVSFRMDRIKALGNAVVPLQAKTAFETLMGLK